MFTLFLSYELCYLSGFINVNFGVTFVTRCEGGSVRTVCDPLAIVYIYTYHELFFVLNVSMKLWCFVTLGFPRCGMQL